MTLLPIVARELRVTSRRAATYWTRVVFAMLAILIGGVVLGMFYRKPARETGFWTFAWLSVVAYLYSLLAGALSTADCVSEEKREGTLGLLFLTDLKSYDIVLGKLAASSLTGIYGLLAIFPVLGVPLLLGGVAAAEFWRVILVCGNNLFLSLATGMICSAICKDERKSIALSVLLIGLLTAGLPAVIAWFGFALPNNHSWHSLFRHDPFAWFFMSPGFQCLFAFDEFYKEMLKKSGANWFYISLTFTHLLGWLALVLTMGILPRVWHDKALTPQALRRREQWRTAAGGSPETRIAFRRQLLEINPFYWLASRDRFKVTLVWLWLGGGLIIWMFGWANTRRDWLDPFTYICTILIAHSFFKCWLPMEASRRLGADRRSGALELLLSTPLSVNEIVRGQGLALLRQFGPAVALICAVDFLFFGLGLEDMGVHGDRAEWTTMWFAGIVIFILDLITLALVAMWSSLRSRKTSTAGLGAIVRVCIVPWLFMAVFTAVVATMEMVFNYDPFRSTIGDVFLGVWFFVSVLVDLLLSISALRNLHTQFRLVVTQRIEPRGMFWRKWLTGNRVELNK